MGLTRMIMPLLFCVSLSAQDIHLFDGALITRTSDSTGLFAVKVPDWSRSYQDFKTVEQGAVLFDTAYHGEKYLISYDSTVTAYPVNDYRFKTMTYPAKLSTRHKVYDGDGFYARIQIPVWSDSHIGQWEAITRKFRGYRFDTYEMRPRKYHRDGTKKTKDEIKREKELAVRARDLTAALLRDYCFTVEYKDKYRNNRWVVVTRFAEGAFEGMTIKQYLSRNDLTTGLYEND